jgi:methylenetetrahydrofolate reductase (NADPH)
MTGRPAKTGPAVIADAAQAQQIAQLARQASIEINVHDIRDLAASRALLPAGKKVYVSHPPRQTWEDTRAACCAVRDAGFDPVPHMPVRLLPDAETLDRLLGTLVTEAGVQEVLLIAGDHLEPVGPYRSVSEALRTGVLERHGLTRVSLAGHPEGHPQVMRDEIRRWERTKVALATTAGLDVTLVTQFSFEAAPFLDWVADLRLQGVRARMVAGLAGPTGLATLFRFALRCGAGPSIRALGARPTSMMKLIGDHGPEQIVRGLAQAKSAGESDFNGFHLFSFGGFLRTCSWLRRVADGQFRFNERDGFDVQGK